MHSSERFVVYPALLALGVFTLSRQETHPARGRIVEAERFVVRDAAGNLRAVLGLDVGLHADPGRRLEGVPRAEGDVGLFLFGNEEKTRVWLFADTGGQTGFVLADQEWKSRAQMHADEDGSTSLELSGGSGEGITSAGLSVLHEDFVTLSLGDAKGVRRVAVGLSEDGSPRIQLSDPKGKPLFSAPETISR